MTNAQPVPIERCSSFLDRESRLQANIHASYDANYLRIDVKATCQGVTDKCRTAATAETAGDNSG